MEPSLPAVLRLDPGPLLVDARFRDFRLATRLLQWSPAARGFRIGAARDADAPADLAWVPGEVAGGQASPGHALVEAGRDGWVVNLPPAARPELWTDDERLAMAPDAERIDLSPRAMLRIPCGAMTYEVRASEPPVRVPRPLVGPSWRREATYALATALFLMVAMVVVFAVPPDTKSLSLDDIAGSHIFTKTVILPPVLPPADAGGGPASPGAPAQSSRPAPPKQARHAHGRAAPTATPASAEQAVEAIVTHSIIGVLNASTSSVVRSIFQRGTPFGDRTTEVLGTLIGTDTGSIWGTQLVGSQTGDDESGPLIGFSGLHTIGNRHDGPGSGPGYGDAVGILRPKTRTVLPEVRMDPPHTNGALDKEIVRRIVRRHLNEVRFCYEEQLARHPGLEGRLVVQFAIAAMGNVLTSVVQSSTLREPRVESCVVAAVRRWEFPAPRGGGLVMVSYPFQLLPAGAAN